MDEMTMPDRYLGMIWLALGVNKAFWSVRTYIVLTFQTLPGERFLYR